MIVVTMYTTKDEFYKIANKYNKDNKDNSFPWYYLMEIDEDEDLPARVYIDGDGDMNLL